MPLLPITPTTRDAVAGERVPLHAGEAERAVAEQEHDLAVRARELGGQRVARAAAEAAERARVQPAARLVGLDRAARVGGEVAAVADHDRVAVEHLAELGVDAQRMQRRARVRRAARAPPRASPPPRRAGAPSSRPSGTPPAVAPAERAQRAREVAVELGGDRARVLALGLGDVDDDQLAVRAERLAEAEPEVHRHADHERDVGALEPGAARAREEERVVGGQAAAREAVEEHGDAGGLGELAQRRPRRGPSRGSCRP